MPTPSSPSRPRATRRSRLLAGALAAGLLSTLPSAASAQLVQWSTAGGGNGHWYQYVSATSIFAPVSFGTALAAAQSSTHLGLQGYLATVTSQAEQDFLNGAFSYLFGFGAVSTAWLGMARWAISSSTAGQACPRCRNRRRVRCCSPDWRPSSSSRVGVAWHDALDRVGALRDVATCASTVAGLPWCNRSCRH